ncbi:MAG: hypothetical protein Unbinned4509contig1000_1 [Prokaryotic dsDNA virus sp.]|nr:MAG: hypothetical protein Unbinned4509contig1000_1 [Prokaryotic dsDNA virus sp.]
MSEFAKEFKEQTKINIADYLTGGNNLHTDNVPVPYPQPINVERAKEATDYFVPYDDGVVNSAYSYVKKSIEDRAAHYKLPDGKSPSFFNEMLRYSHLKASLIRELERMNNIQKADKEEKWWSSTIVRFTGWVTLCLAHLDNKVVNSDQLSCVTGKTLESSRKCLREAEERGYVTSELVDGTRCYKTNINTVNKYYRRIRREIANCSLESLVRQTAFHSFVKYEEEFVRAFQSKKDD